MASHGELFPGRKLRHDGDPGAPEQEYDPPGPLDLDSGVVYLAPRGDGTAQDQQNDADREDGADRQDDDSAQEEAREVLEADEASEDGSAP